mmetsp:Transcript_28266/g.57775  ORF Transcript_28266/g.57775 Transcript_28266/m.57775 type:complete len:224 (+) Transcript_28266:49-720(+)
MVGGESVEDFDEDRERFERGRAGGGGVVPVPASSGGKRRGENWGQRRGKRRRRKRGGRRILLLLLLGRGIGRRGGSRRGTKAQKERRRRSSGRSPQETVRPQERGTSLLRPDLQAPKGASGFLAGGVAPAVAELFPQRRAPRPAGIGVGRRAVPPAIRRFLLEVVRPGRRVVGAGAGGVVPPDDPGGVGIPRVLRVPVPPLRTPILRRQASIALPETFGRLPR